MSDEHSTEEPRWSLPDLMAAHDAAQDGWSGRWICIGCDWEDAEHLDIEGLRNHRAHLAEVIEREYVAERRPTVDEHSAAIERAAQAWFDRIQAQRLDAARKRPDGQRWQWEDLTSDDQNGYRALVAPIVKAVLQ